MPFDPEREHAAVSFRAKQLIVLATDGVLEAAQLTDHDPAAAGLVGARLVPACYAARYDAQFLHCFHNVAPPPSPLPALV